MSSSLTASRVWRAGSAADEEAAMTAAALRAAWPRLLLPDWPTLFAAAMEAWREVRSRIMRSFWSCLSAWTVCACWRRLSRRENCFEQWQVKGRSPVCFLMCLARCSLRLKTMRQSP